MHVPTKNRFQFPNGSIKSCKGKKIKDGAVLFQFPNGSIKSMPTANPILHSHFSSVILGVSKKAAVIAAVEIVW